MSLIVVGPKTRRLLGRACATLIVVGCARAGVTPVARERATIVGSGWPDSVQMAAQALLAFRAAADLTAGVWSHFEIRDAVSLVSVQPGGPVLVVGDANLPPEYRPLTDDPSVSVRVGPVPDSLSRLRLAFPWNGSRDRAIVVRFVGAATEFVLFHEAFHAYQIRLWRADRARFSGTGTISFPFRSVSAVGYELLEGEYLIKALGANAPASRLAAIASALDAAAAKCETVGLDECRDERELELKEGSADYVAWRLLCLTGRVPGSSAIRDTLRKGLLDVRDVSAFSRQYFYGTGAAMYFLIDELRSDDWNPLAEFVPPEEFLRRTVAAMTRGAPAPRRDSAEFDTRRSAAMERARTLIAGTK